MRNVSTSYFLIAFLTLSDEDQEKGLSEMKRSSSELTHSLIATKSLLSIKEVELKEQLNKLRAENKLAVEKITQNDIDIAAYKG